MNTSAPPPNSGNPDAMFIHAVRLHQGGRLAEAVQAYDQTIAVAAGHFAAFCNRGVALLDLGRPADALASFDRALALNGNDAVAHNNRGNALGKLKRPADALASYDRAISIAAGLPLFHINRGNALLDLDRAEEALASFDHAVSLKPDEAMAHNNRGNVLRRLGRLEDALASYDRSLALNRNLADTHYNRANAAKDLRRLDDALAGYDRAIALRPMLTDAHCMRGNVLQDLSRFGEALASYDRALAIDPGRADVHFNRANAHYALDALERALADYDRALALDPEFADVHANRGLTLLGLGRPQEALAAYERNRNDPERHRRNVGMRLYLELVSCNWGHLSERTAEVMAVLKSNEMVSPPFVLLAAIDDPAAHLTNAGLYVKSKYPERQISAPAFRSGDGHRIRIGYVSADFRSHAMMHLLLDVFEKHDKDRFELIGLSTGAASSDDYRRRVVAAFDRFIDIRSETDESAAALARSIGIDIAVDLSGYTQFGRTGIFVERAAPVQVNYLGYPGTMGMPFMDYIVADRVLIEPRNRQCFSENVVYLPDTYQANRASLPVAAKASNRGDWGLPEAAVVFACFNSTYKIMPAMFEIWMRILDRVEGSVLWLLADQPNVRANLRAEAGRRGVDPDRLVFAGMVPIAEHLDRLQLADLFLDTRPYNAHTTTSDALRMGLPVITCPGETFASRVAASLLTAAGMPELIAASLADYEAMAVRLATDSGERAGLRAKLRANLPSCALFDSTRYTCALERAYLAMHARHRAGLPPADIHIAQE